MYLEVWSKCDELKDLVQQNLYVYYQWRMKTWNMIHFDVVGVCERSLGQRSIFRCQDD